MTNRYDTILFDFDFTLVDSSRAVDTCMRHAFKVMNHDFPPPGEADYQKGLPLIDSFIDFSGSDDPDLIENLRKHYIAKADEVMTEKTIFFEDTLHTLESLQDNGYRLGIVSNKYRYRIEEFLEFNSIQDMFEVIVGTEDVEELKPSPEGLHLAMDKIGSKNLNTLFVGDNRVDAETAHRADTGFIGVHRNQNREHTFHDHSPLHIIDSLSRLKTIL